MEAPTALNELNRNHLHLWEEASGPPHFNEQEAD